MSLLILMVIFTCKKLILVLLLIQAALVIHIKIHKVSLQKVIICQHNMTYRKVKILGMRMSGYNLIKKHLSLTEMIEKLYITEEM